MTAAPPGVVLARRLGTVEYEDGLRLMEHHARALEEGTGGETFLLLAHPPVITRGRNAKASSLLASPERLHDLKIELFDAGRGGDVTYHGPGQVIGYPILSLAPDRMDLKRFVRDLEEVLLRALAEFGIEGRRIPGRTGVWVGNEKIAAIGLRVARWITTHGFALNLEEDRRADGLLVPCGIADSGVTSMERVLGGKPSRADVESKLLGHFGQVYERKLLETGVEGESVQVVVYRESRGGELREEVEGAPEATPSAAIEVLALRRLPSRGDFWQPVTGGIEPGEAPAGAAVREVEEETGAGGDLEDLDYIHTFVVDPKLAKRPSPTLRYDREYSYAIRVAPGASIRLDPKEHTEHRWIAPEEALTIFPWSGNRRAVERLLERRKRGA